MSQWYIHGNLVRIPPLVHKIRKSLIIFSFSTAVSLKVRSRSPTSYRFFVMSQLYIHANLVRIQPLVHQIWCRQESVTPMPTPMPTGRSWIYRLVRVFAICMILQWLFCTQVCSSEELWAGLGGSVGCAVRLEEVAGSTPAEIGNILSWRLIMKYFLRSFSPFRWFKKGSCQFLAKECAQYWLTT